MTLDKAKIEVDKVAFEGEKHGYNFKATYLKKPKGDALVEITKGDEVVCEFLFPAYKIWNIAAHAYDSAIGLNEGSDNGIRIASSDGLGGNTYTPDNKPLDSDGKQL